MKSIGIWICQDIFHFNRFVITGVFHVKEYKNTRTFLIPRFIQIPADMIYIIWTISLTDLPF